MNAGIPVAHQHRLVGQREQPRSQRQQLAGKVAAIDRRHVVWTQRLHGLRVVPVEEVAAVALQGLHRGQRRVQAREQLARTDVAEVARGQPCQQREAHVGGRGAVCNASHGQLLHVVGREVVVFGTDVRVEEGPCAAREPPQEGGLFGRQRRLPSLERAVGPPDDEGRQRPQQQQRCGCGECRRALQQKTKGAGHGEHGANRHRACALQQVGQAARRGGDRHLGRRPPFEQAAPRQQHAPQSECDRSQAVGRLIGQAGQRVQQLPQQLPRLRS